MAVDAGVASRNLDSPYVMFVVYMASKKLSRDITLYRHLGKEDIASSWMRFYEFRAAGDFFPPLTLRSRIRADEGFMTKCYFNRLQEGGQARRPGHGQEQARAQGRSGYRPLDYPIKKVSWAPEVRLTGTQGTP